MRMDSWETSNDVERWDSWDEMKHDGVRRFGVTEVGGEHRGTVDQAAEWKVMEAPLL